MKKIFSTIALSAALAMSASGAFAAAHAGAPMAGASKPEAPSQQSKMGTCNSDPKGKGLKGDERKKFMSECLSTDKPVAAKPAESKAVDAKAAPTAQQSKMATCNADTKAKTLKGDERKKFMSECLSADKPVVAAKPAETKAVDAKAAPTAQQSKMATCNADTKAKTLKGDDRKKFMSECLSADKPVAAAKPAETKAAATAQQSKMTACNADTKAKTLKGGERKKFMSECLKG